MKIEVNERAQLPILFFCSKEIERMEQLNIGDVFLPYGGENYITITKEIIPQVVETIKDLHSVREQILNNSINDLFKEE